MISKSVLPAIAMAVASGLAMAAPPSPAGMPEFVGTDAPFASNAIYFVMTDRFVNGDPSNDHRHQGGAHPTFDIPVPGAPKGQSANIGYLGGDFKGVLENAGYIHNMGFGAVWITPIVDNPDQAFTGGDPVYWGSKFTDRGKTGYHGYWGVNFYKVDEHLPSRNLDFAQFTAKMHAAGLKVVQDIVLNHGSPAFTMPVRQPQFGQIFDKSGKLIADEQNLPPWQLDPVRNPLHRFYHAYEDLVQLSNNDDQSPLVLNYMVGAYEQWIDEGSDAFRIDTISHMSTTFWKQFSARIRASHPGFFMFGEAFDYSPDNIGKYTWARNGGISLLDFPLQQAVKQVFEHPDSDFAALQARLYLTNGPYANPYELVTFYDNHDMARLAATDNGFIDADNFLFTARGIPAIYYGSEIGFERGMAEHQGNRNYFGQQRIDDAPEEPDLPAPGAHRTAARADPGAAARPDAADPFRRPAGVVLSRLPEGQRAPDRTGTAQQGRPRRRLQHPRRPAVRPLATRLRRQGHRGDCRRQPACQRRGARRAGLPARCAGHPPRSRRRADPADGGARAPQPLIDR